jgi:ClpP class serine protease
MEEVLQYLEMKNHYYEKFYSITQKFLDHIARNDWKDMEFFVDSRERILNIIRSFDAKISKAVETSQKKKSFSDEERSLMSKMMAKRKVLADKIVDLDLQVIAAIDDYKNETIRELKKTVEVQQQMDSFEKNSAPNPRSPKLAKAS